MKKKQGYVYILTNTTNRVLYTGVTNDLLRRVTEHKLGLVEGFSKAFNTTKLVYFEDCGDIVNAITREKQIKAGPRRAKVALINRFNPGWIDVVHAAR